MEFSSNCELMDEACGRELSLGDPAHRLRIPRGISAPPYLGLSFTRGFNESVLDYGFPPTALRTPDRQAPASPARHLSL